MKSKYLAAIIIALVVIVGIVLLTTKPKTGEHASMQPSSSATAVPSADANSVSISNYNYSPTPLKVKKGTKVTWTNHDTAKHTVTMDSGQTAGGPDTSLFGKNETFSFTFDTVGTYKYHCSPHPYMHGSVEVTE